MARVLFTRSADSDTAQILADLGAKAGRRVAERYDGDFGHIYRQLAKYPESGAPRSRLGKRVRISILAPYIIFYEYAEADDNVLILRIAHGRRKVTSKFLRGEMT